MPTILLPPYSFHSRQPKIPHRRSVLARHEDAEGREYTLVSNHKGNRFWLHATRGGFRSSDTIATSSPVKGARWEAAVKAGEVAIGKDGDKFGDAKSKGSICGLITAKEVLRFAPQIARDFGPKALMRCCVAMVRRKKTTFLQCALAPGGVFDGKTTRRRKR